MPETSRIVPVGTLVALLMSACDSSGSPAAAVRLDGLFDEWTEAATLVDDPPDAPDAAVDVLSIQALDEPAWLYLAIDVGNEVSIQSLPGTLHLLLDMDADRGSGGSVEGMAGVDLVVDLSQTSTPLSDGRGAGFALRLVQDDGGFREVEWHVLRLMAAPTWAAPRFELRLSRSGGDQLPRFGARMRIKAIYSEGDDVLDETEIGSYAFRSRPDPSPTGRAVEGIAARLEPPPGTFRVALWNVASGSFTRRSEGFARVLSSLEPDVVLLDEVPGDVSSERLRAFFESPPLAQLGPWGLVLGRTGGVQRAAIAARGHPIEPAARLTSVPYPGGALATLGSRLDGTGMPVATEASRGVSAAGARVDMDGRRILFVAVDLQSGGWPGSTRDRLRAIQASTIREHVTAELIAEPTPVVIGGDLNLVASRTPLFTLVRGLDVDGSDLVPLDAERLGERSLATWRNPRDVFAPGRLDFVLLPDAALTAAGSFVFATEDLDSETLARLGLDVDTMRGLSDHLIVVADLRFGS